MTITEHLREHLLTSRGLITRKPVPTLESLQETEVCHEFHRLRKARLILGAMRYGLMGAKGKPKWDRISDAIRRLRLYQESKNKEYLLDVANFMELEWVEGDGFYEGTHDPNLHTEVVHLVSKLPRL